MFTANMIKYTIDDETKTITASVCGIEDDAISTMLKSLRMNNLILDEYITCKKYKLPDHLTASAKYDPNDPNPYSEVRGKMIARRRLYNKYNKEYNRVLSEVKNTLTECISVITDCQQLATKRIIKFEDFEFYDIKKIEPANKSKE